MSTSLLHHTGSIEESMMMMIMGKTLMDNIPEITDPNSHLFPEFLGLEPFPGFSKAHHLFPEFSGVDLFQG